MRTSPSIVLMNAFLLNYDIFYTESSCTQKYSLAGLIQKLEKKRKKTRRKMVSYSTYKFVKEGTHNLRSKYYHVG